MKKAVLVEGLARVLGESNANYKVVEGVVDALNDGGFRVDLKEFECLVWKRR